MAEKNKEQIEDINKIDIINFILRAGLLTIFLFTFARGVGLHNLYIGHFTIELLIAVILYVLILVVDKKIEQGEEYHR